MDRLSEILQLGTLRSFLAAYEQGDSGVRSALKHAAAAEGCDFPGFGPHSLRRANITWRQEVGGSSIETSQIAGHIIL
jgi:hypothetical protein